MGRWRRRVAMVVAMGAAACGSSEEKGLHGAGTATGGATADGSVPMPGTGGAGEGGAGAESGGGMVGSSGGAAGQGQATGGSAGSVGLPIACDSDRQCTPLRMLCDRQLGHCVECVFDADCAAGSACRSSRCEQVYPCVNSRDCVDAPGNRAVCDGSAGECVECVTTADCAVNSDCTARSCVSFTPCTNSLDCGTTQVCDVPRGRCVGCVGNADCDAGRVCRDQVCTVPTCVAQDCTGRCGAVPDGCGVTLDCGPCGTHCANGIQDSDETGVDCGGGLCVPCTGAPLWGACLVDADCADGRICSKAIQDAVLPGRYGFCTRACASAAECESSPAGAEPVSCVAPYYCYIPCGATLVCPGSMECVVGALTTACRHGMTP